MSDVQPRTTTRAETDEPGKVLIAEYVYEMRDELGLTESEICVRSRIVDAERFDRSVSHYIEMGESYPKDKAIRWLLAEPEALR